jgi:hypothetical protein
MTHFSARRSGSGRASGAGAGIAIPIAAMLMAAASPAAAQSNQVLTGRVDIDLPGGSISADVCLSGLPAAGDTLSLVLNRAYTIKGINGAAEPPVLMELEPGGAAIRYTFLREPSDAVAPASREAAVCLEYGGSHPVYDIAAGDYRSEDASSVIAFNGSTVRARGASRWYPVAFHRGTRLAEEAVAFRLEIVCAACELIYVNGGAPSPGPNARFTSREPREIFLVAGRLPLTTVHGGRIIGESVAPDSAAAFLRTLEQIQEFYSDYLRIPFGPPADIVRIEAVREPRRGQIWGFFSDPALTLMGMTIPEFVEILEDPEHRAHRSLFGLLAHELAHRYFGWGIGYASPQRELFGEPFATVLELEAVRQLLGEEQYLASVRALRNRAGAGPAPRPLDEAGPEDFAFDSYRYGFAPFALVGLQETIGTERMRALIASIVTAPAHRLAVADFAFLKSLAFQVGVSSAEWADWEDRCVRADEPNESCLRRPSL